MAEADAFGFGIRDLEPVLTALQGWQSGLVSSLKCCHLDTAGLSPDSPLCRQSVTVNTMLSRLEHRWARQWVDLEPARQLAETFDDRVMLVIFGKFNAGKSSLCNLLAQRFGAQGRRVRYFHVESGQLTETSQAFREGATETTARLQGVCLGDRIVLLDTPGLHSVTADNAALTQRFIESADAMLWLTSSTSPGQVQELDGLARELHRGKPLLPVITRSDTIEEDEVGDEIVSVLRNKTAANRSLQEADVEQRAADKLQALGVHPGLLRPPVSISAQMVGVAGSTDAAMSEAGFERLYDALEALAAHAIAYKARKPAEILLHHLHEDVLGSLCDLVMPALDGLREEARAELDLLTRQEAHIVQGAWRAVVPELPAVLEKHKDEKSVGAMCSEVAASMTAALISQTSRHLPQLAIDRPSVAAADLKAAELDAFRPGGAGYLMSHEQLHAALEASVRAGLAHHAARIVAQSETVLMRLISDVQRLTEAVSSAEHQLAGLREQCRPGAPDGFAPPHTSAGS